MKLLKISIIVPVYNCAKYLHQCMESLINQTLKEIEIICINDGSTDNSAQILQEYAQKDPRIKIINKENGGQALARNIGIDIADGEYIGFVDSDDWVSLDFFEKLYNAAQKYDAEIAAASIIRLSKLHKKYHLKFTEEKITDDYKTKLQTCNIPELSYVWNKIYKTSRIKESNLKFTEGRLYEDVVFTPQALYYLKKLVTVPNTYYYYRRRAGSTVSLKTQKTNEDAIWARKEMQNFFIKHNVDDIKTSNTRKYKLFGLSVFKIKTYDNIKTYMLFNIIKWKIKTG